MARTTDVSEKHLDVRSWAEDIEQSAQEQIENLKTHPALCLHVAVMPDVHAGYGVPIGSVICSDSGIIPNAVGVDIGCGVLAVRLNRRASGTQRRLERIVDGIRVRVPMGFNKRVQRVDVYSIWSMMPMKHPWLTLEEYNDARHKLGTLGGGNHFIEIQKDMDGYTWVMIHSGSRHIGKVIADYYHEKAVSYTGGECPKDLAYLPNSVPEAGEYRDAMQWACSYGAMNRRAILVDVIEAFEAAGGNPVNALEVHDVRHNYAAYEKHFDRLVWVHRKGATSAKEGEIGIIPGSQGTVSYIVKGLGNPESFNSCSHGAGRKMSRSAARKNLQLEDEVAAMSGVLHSIQSEEDLDEAPGAYKDIETVMKQQHDLVSVVNRLKPMAVLKG